MSNYNNSLGRKLGFTLRLYSKSLNALFEEEGIKVTVEQFIMMNIVLEYSGKTGITQIELSNIVGKDKSAILRHLDTMEDHKLLVRKDVAGDRRKKMINLTNKGEELLKKSRLLERKLTKTVMKNMSAVEINQFMDSLDKIQMNIIENVLEDIMENDYTKIRNT